MPLQFNHRRKTMKRVVRILVLAALLTATFAMPVAAQSPAKSYLIMAQGNSLPANLTQQVSKAGGTLTRTIPEIGLAVASSSNPNFASKVARIDGIRSVVYNVSVSWVTPTYRQALGAYGNPPASGDDDFLFDLQWGHDAVDAPEAWVKGERGAGVRVAVLDDGIDSDHPDLAPNLNVGLSTSFVPGEPFEYIENFPGDPFSHGTHVAGTIAAADNAYGTIGVAPEAEIIMVKVLSSLTGSGTFEGVIAGIVYAANIDADIINMSLGARIKKSGDCDPDCYTAKEAAELLVALGRATTYAYQQGTTVIAAAGNDGEDIDHNADAVFVPAQSPHVIAVAATGPLGWGIDPSTNLDVPAFYTNFGQSVIDFAAPGGNVDFSLYPGPNPMCTVVVLRPCWVFDLVFSTGSAGSWYWSAGTSMAAPHASGVAAIIIGKNGGSMHPAQVEAALRASADDLGKPGNDDFYGAGRVNAGNAVP
jgi:subtilisin family serine protease